jgi:predicted enzyme related to lactoylglutathione lyase
MWLAYVGVDDVKASTAKAKSLGARVVVDVREVPGHGQMSVLSDGRHHSPLEPKKA